MGPSSLFNHVLGPVMHGPSSSHTAASFHIGRIARSALGESPVEADIAFDPVGAYAEVYRQQGSDRAFAMGIMGRDITDPVYKNALEAVRGDGVDLTFKIKSLKDKDHPNAVEVFLKGASGRKVPGRPVRGRRLRGGHLRGGIGLPCETHGPGGLAEEGASPLGGRRRGWPWPAPRPEWSHEAGLFTPPAEEPPGSRGAVPRRRRRNCGS